MPELTAAEYRALCDDMRLGPYYVRPSVQLVDLEHNVLDDLSDLVTEGQVDWRLGGVGRPKGGSRKAPAAVSSSSCSLTLNNPRGSVALSRAFAGRGGAFYDQMISAGVEFRGARLDRWIRIPCFTGPAMKGVRTAGQIQISCVGKERLAFGQTMETITYKTPALKVDVVRDLLIRAGEDPARIKLPGLAANLPKDLVVLELNPYWAKVRELVSSMSRQALYDARGDFRMRALPVDPALVVRGGDGGLLLTEPEVTIDGYQGANGIRVLGPEQAGQQLKVTVWLPAGHPLSPFDRARNGKPYRQLIVHNEPQLRTGVEANDIAMTRLRALSREYVNATCDVIPNWLLEPGDIWALETPQVGRMEQTLSEFSVPLMPGAAMSLGAVKPVTRPRPKPGQVRRQGAGKPPRTNHANPLRRARSAA